MLPAEGLSQALCCGERSKASDSQFHIAQHIKT
jgi:hypothetical protein